MKKSLMLVISLVVLAITMGGCATSSPAATPTVPAATPTPGVPSTASVSIAGFAFQPGEVTIAKGGTVTWTNDDSVTHTVKFADSQSPGLQNGGTYSKTFDSAGAFDYSCGIHPTMKGTVIVA